MAETDELIGAESYFLNKVGSPYQTNNRDYLLYPSCGR